MSQQKRKLAAIVFMISSIGKRTTYILCSILLILATSCSTLPNGSKNWSENTLKKLSLREKIGQMLIYRMNLRLKDIPPSKWKEIVDLIDSDGLGGVHPVSYTHLTLPTIYSV